MQRCERAVPGVELPAPTAQSVLMRVWVQAFLATAHIKRKKRAKAFLKYAARILADEDSISNIAPIRSASSHEAVLKARREALAMFQAQAPSFISMLPER